MKAAIITITDGANYGNRLQNFAMQTTLEQLGCEAETFQRRTSRDKSAPQKAVYEAKQLVKKLIGRPTDDVIRRRRKRFQAYNQNYIRFSDVILQQNQAPAGLDAQYAYFICGSDQIWNTRFTVIREDVKNYLAAFAPGSKRIAYAASFGTVSVDEEFKADFSAELQKFKAIGVREAEGETLVRELSGRDAQVVLDPTMLLGADTWREKARKPEYISSGESILVTYFMTGRSPAIEQYIESVKDAFHCKRVINLEMEFLSPKEIRDPDVFCTAPDEFLWLISHAECVLTDSFHATVFSLLFHKPFVVFQRQAAEKGNQMQSRIETLLGYFDLGDRMDDISNATKLPASYDCDKVDAVIAREKQRSLQFLRSALEIG